MNKIITTIALFALLASTAFAQVDRSVEPTPDKPREINLGDLKSITLDNGLKVFLVPKPGYGKFAFSLTINQYDINNDPQQELRDILNKAYYECGTPTYNRDQFDSIVDYHGAKLGVTINGGFAIGLAEDEEVLMNLYTDRLFNVTADEYFIKEYAEKHKTNKKLAKPIEHQKNISLALLDSLMNDGTVARKPKDVTKLDYASVTPEQVRAFNTDRVSPNNGTAILLGDFTEKSAKQFLNKYFGDWKPGTECVKEESEKGEPKMLDDRRVFVIDNPEAVQSRVSLHWNLGDAYQYFDKSFELEVMSQILGGYTLSYVYDNLRNDKGLCYYAFADAGPTGAGGKGHASTQVRTDKTDVAVENFIYEMLRIRNQKVTEETLRTAKNSMLGQYARSLGGIALQRFLSFAMVKDAYDLPDDYLKTYPAKIGEVTIEDVQEMALKYVKPNNCIIMIEGKAEELKDLNLERFGPIEYYSEEGKRIMND